MKYHAHIYKIDGLFEVDVEAETEVEAKTKALELSESASYKPADCKKIALAWEEKPEEPKAEPETVTTDESETVTVKEGE